MERGDVLLEAALADLHDNASEAQLVQLHDEIEQWYLILVDRLEDVDQQVRIREAQLERRYLRYQEAFSPDEAQRRHARDRGEFLEWRTRALGFKRLVQRQLAEVKLERNQRRDERYAVRVSDQLHALRHSVLAHEADLRTGGTAACAADEALWALARSFEPSAVSAGALSASRASVPVGG
jgi:hypothetical protein